MNSTPPEKAEVAQAEHASDGRGHHASHRDDEKDRIDALAEAPGVTMETFAHLDEKKILRKVCRHIQTFGNRQSDMRN